MGSLEVSEALIYGGETIPATLIRETRMIGEEFSRITGGDSSSERGRGGSAQLNARFGGERRWPGKAFPLTEGPEVFGGDTFEPILGTDLGRDPVMKGGR
jgi:hypothetical protein